MSSLEAALAAAPFGFWAGAIALSFAPRLRLTAFCAGGLASLGVLLCGALLAGAFERPLHAVPPLAALALALAAAAAALWAHGCTPRAEEPGAALLTPALLGLAGCLCAVQQAQDLFALVLWLGAAELLRVSVAALTVRTAAALDAAKRQFALRLTWIGFMLLGLAIGWAGMGGGRTADAAAALHDPRAALAVGLLAAGVLMLLIPRPQPPRGEGLRFSTAAFDLAADGAALLALLALFDAARLSGAAHLLAALGWGALGVFAWTGLCAARAQALAELAGLAWRAQAALAAAALAFGAPLLAGVLLGGAFSTGLALHASAALLPPGAGSVQGFARRRPWAAAPGVLALASVAAAPPLAGFSGQATLVRTLLEHASAPALVFLFVGQGLWTWAVLRVLGALFDPREGAQPSAADWGAPPREAWAGVPVGLAAATLLLALGLTGWPFGRWP